jgi:hypothetical protein
MGADYWKNMAVNRAITTVARYWHASRVDQIALINWQP